MRTGEISSIWSSLSGGDAPPPIPRFAPLCGGDASACMIDSARKERENEGGGLDGLYSDPRVILFFAVGRERRLGGKRGRATSQTDNFTQRCEHRRRQVALSPCLYS